MTSTPAPRPFAWRAFVSLVVALAFVVLGTTGIALYMTPPGRVANWSGWTLAGLTKADWQAVHMVFGFLFVAAGAFHLFYNWRVLLAYLRSRVDAGRRYRRELAWATATGLALVVASVADIPPVSVVADGRERLANLWATDATEPPIAHAELMTVERLAASLNLTTQTAIERLGARGVAATADVTLAKVAEREGVTPQSLYTTITGRSVQSAAPPVAGSGQGWKTVRQVAEENHLTVETAVARLHAAGLEARPDDALRDVAKHGGRHAPEVLGLIVASAR